MQKQQTQQFAKFFIKDLKNNDFRKTNKQELDQINFAPSVD